MKEIKPPSLLNFSKLKDQPSMGLFGSIEQGKATNWQKKATAYLTCYDLSVFNPRREQWDDSWEQSADNPIFAEQVNWELDALENVKVPIFYFEPGTKSPVTLLELGLIAGRNLDAIVCCPDGYWRKDNVELVCEKYGIHMEKTLEDLVADAVSRLTSYHDMKLLPKTERIPIVGKIPPPVIDPIDTL